MFSALPTLALCAVLAASSDPVLVEFQSADSSDCRAMQSTIQRLVSEGVAVRRVDVDREPRTAQQYRVVKLPTYLLFVEGREADRLVGAASYQQLVEFIDRGRNVAADAPGPATAGAPAAERLAREAQNAAPRATPSDPSRETQGGPRSPARDAATDRAAHTAPPSERGTSSGFGVLPQFKSLLGGNESTDGQSAGGQNNAGGNTGNGSPPARNSSTVMNGAAAQAAPPATALARAALAATVRLRVEDVEGQPGQSIATGTIIDAHGDEALVLTCGHVFRESGGKGRIWVDLFAPGAGQPVAGELIDFDLYRDIAVVAIRPGMKVAPVAVATAAQTIAVGQSVFSIGCNHGDKPTVVPSSLTGIQRYDGPPNIVVAGAPVDGRSGGGLFSSDGRLIGVCNAADFADDEGIYAALGSVHWQLDQIGQARIYGGRDVGAIASDERAAPRQPRNVEPMSMASPPSANSPAIMPSARTQPAPNSPPSGHRHGFPLADAQLTIYVQSKSDPNSPPQVLHLDQVSSDLLDRLTRDGKAVVAPPRGAEPFSPTVAQPRPVAPQGRSPIPAPAAPVMRGQNPPPSWWR
ncbi:MAG TPA: trypsin-like peptidase domain-containing protein [Pirellulaceae bacterium]|nr:trypsin-like peptidase domain-containing protein [Pirellulaceae bacterium]